MYLFIGSVTLAIVVSFLCSLCEATVLSLTPGEIAKLSEKHPRAGKIWSTFKHSIDRPIAVILIFNTAAHTLGATIAGAQFEKIWSSQGILIFSIIFTLVILLLTEIVPKNLGVEHRKKLAVILARPLKWLIQISSPLIFIVKLVTLPFIRSKKIKRDITLEELRSLAAHARLSNLIGSHQEMIIHGASILSQKTAKEIMIPVKEIIYFNAESPLEDLIVRAHLDPHTRFPICSQNDLDHILGYVNFKDLLFSPKNNPNNPSLEGIIRPIPSFSPEMPLHKLLTRFIEEHIHIAMIQNHAKKTLGLITLEDIIEEFLGNIEDEFDRLPKMLHQLSGGTWMVGGGISWGKLSEVIPIEPFKGTLADHLMTQVSESVKTGDQIQLGNFDFIIRRKRRSKIFEVMIIPHQAQRVGP